MKLELGEIIVVIVSIFLWISFKCSEYFKQKRKTKEFEKENPLIGKAKRDLKGIKKQFFPNFAVRIIEVWYDQNFKKTSVIQIRIIVAFIDRETGKKVRNFLSKSQSKVENLAFELSQMGIPNLNPQILDVDDSFSISIPAGYGIDELREKVNEAFKWGKMSEKLIIDFEKATGVKVNVSPF